MTIELHKRLSPDSPADEHDVREIKKALNRLGYYIPLPQTGITNIPDLKLFNALKAFQKEQGLKPTGTIRPEDNTIDALNEKTQNESGQYIWRTVGDGQVRESHATLNGTIRNFSDSPTPGDEPNCRCWAEPINQEGCKNKKEQYIKANKRVKDLSTQLNNTLLGANKLIEENNKLIRDAQKSLGTQFVSYIITLPFNKLDIIGELLQKYFGQIISDESLKAAENFVQQKQAIKNATQNLEDQIRIIIAELEKADLELESTKKELENCEKDK